jgi:hypothetical protein
MLPSFDKDRGRRKISKMGGGLISMFSANNLQQLVVHKKMSIQQVTKDSKRFSSLSPQARMSVKMSPTKKQPSYVQNFNNHEISGINVFLNSLSI